MDRKIVVRLILAGALLVPAICVSIRGFAAECTSICGAGQAMQFRQGPNFYHAAPAGWDLMKEDNAALVLRSRDKAADIIVSGVSGLTEQLTPEVFAYQRMTTSLGLTNVRFLGVVYINPMAAYETAAIMEMAYTAPAGPMRGLVISNVANIHDRNVYKRTDAVLTIVGAKQRIWDAYADWLPEVAMQAVNNGPSPFGATAVSATVPNDGQRNQVATEHKNWVKRTWDEFVEFRARAQAGRSPVPGTVPAGPQWYDNPYGGPPVRQFASPAVIWINRNGQHLPSDDPAFDPRTPADPDWQRLVLKKP